MNTPPLLAIVGRPNVGKSALFNRIVRRRLAIVHAEEGVTRDRLIAPGEWNGRRFLLVDTGGLALPSGKAPEEDGEFSVPIAEQVATAVADAARIVFVVDIRAGLKPLDAVVADLLRKSGKSVVVAANKADVPAEEAHAGEFAPLAWPVVPVSAEHARGIDELLEAATEGFPKREEGAEDEPPDERIRIAVVGRPNVGKSSFINRLTGAGRLIVSAVPGTTRDAIEVPFGERGADGKGFLLVDTAGMRRRGKVRESVEKFSAFRATGALEDCDIACLVVDAVAGPQEQEKKIVFQAKGLHKAMLVLVNKWDQARASGVTRERYETELRKALFLPEGVPVAFVSAKSGYRVKAAGEAIAALAGRMKMKLPTGLLNRVLRDAFAKTQPPTSRGKILRFYYATQTGERPPRVTLFVNDPELETPQHQAYLAAALRRAFDLNGVPLILRYRSSHERDGAASPPPRKEEGRSKKPGSKKPGNKEVRSKK
jgi:GTP-binding protein